MNFFNRFSSIQFKMMAVFLPIVLIASISITTLNFFDAKKEITNLIEEKVDNKLNGLVEEIEHEFTAHKRTAQGVASLYQAKNNTLMKEEYESNMSILKEIHQMEEIVESIREIATSNNDNTQSVSAATQQQTAIIEEVTSATEELANMASALQLEISKFKI